MKIIKFTVKSFFETAREQESFGLSFGGKNGVVASKVQKSMVWDYQIMDTNGNEWKVCGSSKRWIIKNGEVIYSIVQNSNWVNWRLTELEFIKRCARRIDLLKVQIKEAEIEIDRLRSL